MRTLTKDEKLINYEAYLQSLSAELVVYEFYQVAGRLTDWFPRMMNWELEQYKQIIIFVFMKEIKFNLLQDENYEPDFCQYNIYKGTK